MADDQGYQWDTNARRYRAPSGRFVSNATIKGIRNRIAMQHAAEARALADRAVTNKIGVDAFVRDMRALIKQTYIMEYMLGRGGRNAMTAQDRGRIGAALKTQYQYLNRFADQINERSVSRIQAQNRAEMYLSNTRGAWDRGQAAAWGANLPAYPCDGGTECLSNCKCSWDIRESGKGASREIRAYWRTNSAEPCEGCSDRARRYKPHRIPRPASGS